MSDLRLELGFALRERTVRWTLIIAALLSSYALWAGLGAVQQQHAVIQDLTHSTSKERSATLKYQQDAGSAGYYAFHFTYDPPSPLTFTAFGVRDDLPWQHRLRMPALTGQIYEADTGNPELSFLGRLDFAFLASTLLPLLMILLLFDLDSRERREGRYELLLATSRHGEATLLNRARARALLLFAALGVPFLIAGASAPFAESLLVLAAVAAHIVFWLYLCRWVTAKNIEGTTAVAILLGVWLLVAMVIPAAGKLAVERSVTVPQGGEILLVQREAVNDGWDLPKADTMEPFVTAYPELRDYADMAQAFEWKWYYAFHHLGDLTAKPLEDALHAGMQRRQSAMGWVALFSPPLMVERTFTRLAATDIEAHQAYLDCVRDFHASLRHFHYPMLFGAESYSVAKMSGLPTYQPCT